MYSDKREKATSRVERFARAKNESLRCKDADIMLGAIREKNCLFEAIEAA
jgi:hypothetical protein